MKRIILTGLAAGTLDALAAVIHYLIGGGTNPTRIFNFIASGVLGAQALSGGLPAAFLGLLFHFMIATIWAWIFFAVYPSLKSLQRNWVFSGTIYGIIVWLSMNLVVVPLSRTPPLPLSASRIFLGASILIVCIGLPIAFSARSYFSKTAGA